jgi:hypothetical protein
MLVQGAGTAGKGRCWKGDVFSSANRQIDNVYMQAAQVYTSPGPTLQLLFIMGDNPELSCYTSLLHNVIHWIFRHVTEPCMRDY